MASGTFADSSLGHEVENTSSPLRISRIPVLDSRVLHVRIFLHDYLHDCGMELVLVPHRSGTPFHVADIGAFIGNYQRPFKLPCPLCIDSEVAGQLHRTPHAFRDVAEGSVAEHCGIECRIEIVPCRDNSSQIFSHQVRMLLDSLRKRTEYYPFL